MTHYRTALLLCVAAAFGGGATWFLLRDKPREQVQAPAGEKQKAEPVDEIQLAVLKCQTIAKAVDAYLLDPKNALEDSPLDLTKLSPEYIRHDDDLLDPWGKPLQIAVYDRKDGVERLLIFTTSPARVRISQYGVGELSNPPK